ncbi:beta strand repeat-containing protein, partial [Muriicola sp. SD30]|uniref:beta strand repeat-containing protein n=1 Tax=Muriicola sp. SD30 TaxID=3240936 RepID=UPI0035107F9E
TVSAGTAITVNQVGQNFEVVNTAPDQTVTLADGGSGNVTIGGTYPNLTVDVASLNDADSNPANELQTLSQVGNNVTLSDGGGTISVADNDNDPTNENQTVSAGTGVNVNQVGQNYEVVNTAPDQTVTLVDGGNGNVTIGGTYPNLTINVPDNNDNSPANELQTLSQVGNNVTLSDGGGTISVADNDNDPGNENQTVSAGTAITVNQVGQNFEVVNTAPDQTVTLADGGSGNVTIGGTYPNLTVDVASLNDADSNPANELQTLSQVGNNVTLSDGGGTISVADNDNDPTNENQTVSAGTGININQVGQNFEVVNTAPDQTVTLADGGNGNVTIGGTYPNLTIDVPDNNDNSAANELQTLSQVGNNVTLSDGGGTISVADNDNDSTNEIQTITSTDGSISITPSGNDYDLSVTSVDPTNIFHALGLIDGANVNGALGGVIKNHNIASVTRASAGRYTINFTTAADNTSYIVQLTLRGLPIGATIVVSTSDTTNFGVWIDSEVAGIQTPTDAQFYFSIIDFP